MVRDYDKLSVEARNNPCSICMCDLTAPKKEDAVQDEEKIVQLACSDMHVYHLVCMKEWSKHKITCPTCRKNFYNSGSFWARN